MPVHSVNHTIQKYSSRQPSLRKAPYLAAFACLHNGPITAILLPYAFTASSSSSKGASFHTRQHHDANMLLKCHYDTTFIVPGTHFKNRTELPSSGGTRDRWVRWGGSAACAFNGHARSYNLILRSGQVIQDAVGCFRVG